MNKVKTLGITILIVLTGFSLSAREYQTSKDGVNVTVKKINDNLKGFKLFQVTVKNTNNTKKTLNSKIFLQNRNVKQPKGGSGDCTIFIQLAPGQTRTEKKQCKETSKSNDWSFEIVKIYNFWLD